jgi:hypothetical protein
LVKPKVRKTVLYAYKNNEIVGRLQRLIGGVVIKKTKLCFGWFDVIDDIRSNKQLEKYTN